MDDKDDIEAAPAEEWDVAATRALADLIRSCEGCRSTQLHDAAVRAANALADAVVDYHRTAQAGPEVTH